MLAAFSSSCWLCDLSKSSLVTDWMLRAGLMCGRWGRCSGASDARPTAWSRFSCAIPGTCISALPSIDIESADATDADVPGPGIGGSIPLAFLGLEEAADLAEAPVSGRAAPPFFVSPKMNSSDLFSLNSFAKPKSTVMMPYASGSAHTSPMRSTTSRSAASTTSLPTTSPISSVASDEIAGMSSSMLSVSTACVLGRRSCSPNERAKLSDRTNMGLRNSMSPMVSLR
mmetsp:Transcript_21260/g.57218  ORF Transcript_21260/g.57218 Transcript_21260/m.57218 type:complete len:228 (+) Transcript_21260:1287-1970(+)